GPGIRHRSLDRVQLLNRLLSVEEELERERVEAGQRPSGSWRSAARSRVCRVEVSLRDARGNHEQERQDQKWEDEPKSTGTGTHRSCLFDIIELTKLAG